MAVTRGFADAGSVAETAAVDATQRVPGDAPEMTVRPEIGYLRDLLQRMGSDAPEERETVLAEAKGAARLVNAIVACVRLENDLHPSDEHGVARGLEAIIGRALLAMGHGEGEKAEGREQKAEDRAQTKADA